MFDKLADFVAQTRRVCGRILRSRFFRQPHFLVFLVGMGIFVHGFRSCGGRLFVRVLFALFRSIVPFFYVSLQHSNDTGTWTYA